MKAISLKYLFNIYSAALGDELGAVINDCPPAKGVRPGM